MNSVSRNVILDLLPVYIAGEASEETKVLVEEFAKNDQEIATLIEKGDLDHEIISEKSIPEDLEIKTIKRVQNSIRRKMLYVALLTASILIIPYLAMFFTNEVKWTIFDFIVMGLLVFGTGAAYVLVTRISKNKFYRIAVGIAVVTGFLLVWINLAVGIIGSENNPANQLYLGVILVGIVGSAISRFRPVGMSRTLYAVAISQFLIPFIAMMIWKPSFEHMTPIVSILFLNSFIAVLFGLSGSLFNMSSKE